MPEPLKKLMATTCFDVTAKKTQPGWEPTFCPSVRLGFIGTREVYVANLLKLLPHLQKENPNAGLSEVHMWLDEASQSQAKEYNEEFPGALQFPTVGPKDC